MSVSFFSNLSETVQEIETGCLCAQMAPNWDPYLVECSKEELKEYADPSCPFCNGTGIDRVPAREECEFTLSNDNAKAFLAVMGIAEETCELSLPMARRALMKYHNTSKDNVAKFLRTPTVNRRTSAENSKIVTRFVYEGGLSFENIEHYVSLFQALVECRGVEKIRIE